MRQLAFLLALPKGFGARDPMISVDQPALVESFRPSFWASSGTPHYGMRSSELVIGHIFSTDHSSTVGHTRFFDGDVAPPERARHLVERFWGAYLYAGRDPMDRTWHIMTDPSGLLPVFTMDHGEARLFASDAALFQQCSGLTPGIAWSSVTAHLLRPEMRQRRTCLEGVDELVPGSLISVGAWRQDQQIWQAERFARTLSSMSFSEHAGRLRYVSTSVVGTWAGQFGKTAVAASGGVDSSLICAAASLAGATFSCVSVATQDRSGDETRYAQAVAEAFGVRFDSRPYDPALFDPTRCASAGLPRPARRAFLSVLDKVLGEAMAEHGAETVLDGNGGDNVFCFLHSAAPLVDRLRFEGPGRGACATLLDLCAITGCSVPTMLGAALRRLRMRHPFELWPADTSLLNPDLDLPEDCALTPWHQLDTTRRTGWQDHLVLLMHSQNQVHGAGSALPRFSPLASQPLVEFCLTVPSWQWTRGGINRALARAAFADILPRSVLARTSKAGPDSFIRTAYNNNRAAITERLLDGLLARHALIDRPAVERALGEDAFRQHAPVDRLLDLLETENWLQTWSR